MFSDEEIVRGEERDETSNACKQKASLIKCSR